MSKSKQTRLRLGYTETTPFSCRLTVLLIILYLLTASGLIAFNFFTQAKQRVCASLSTSKYDNATCSASSLRFLDTVYTKPIDSDASPSIGTFPWQPQGFGVDNGPIDYSLLSLNWTGEALECALFEQQLILRLESDSSTTSTCYYCGPNLRVMCMLVDSERTSLPPQSVEGFASLLTKYDDVLAQMRAIATTAFSGTTVTSLRMTRHVRLQQLAAGVLPYNTSSLSIQLGTNTLGFLSISTSQSDSAVAAIASAATTLSDDIETVASRDLQPDGDDSTSSKRTLLVNYLCLECVRHYKPIREIVAVILGSTTGVLATLFGLYCAAAQFYHTRDKSPPSSSNSTTGLSALGYQPTGHNAPPPVFHQQSSYLSCQSSHGQHGAYYGNGP